MVVCNCFSVISKFLLLKKICYGDDIFSFFRKDSEIFLQAFTKNLSCFANTLLNSKTSSIRYTMDIVRRAITFVSEESAISLMAALQLALSLGFWIQIQQLLAVRFAPPFPVSESCLVHPFNFLYLFPDSV